MSDLPLDFQPPPDLIEVELKDGQRATLRPPSAGLQEELLEADVVSVAQRRTWLLARIVVSLGGATGPFEESFARALPVTVRRELEETLECNLPDLDLSMQAVCQDCQREFSAPLDVASFFFLVN